MAVDDRVNLRGCRQKLGNQLANRYVQVDVIGGDIQRTVV
jgi:hypothetical protein